ncbi:cysteine--tRNA ligase [Sandaracinobacteroides saxicola]|uniref:Cysteine--tRNA ligase n=1 Tax=Sandaracinobacteroides saxicola TaxID=2759707 RepID=A0A7G5IIY9_9SPHN|nr:cysteine--tRNA ligase [Sandaracinobacteroides saxicola]QMW23331.1 cysteine--tRNA ligase [Sandaracinobacteroides saxicola]
MSELRLWNTMTRQKEAVRLPEPGKPVTMYVCGPTVYGRAHIGNARPAVVFDVLYRLLRHLHGAENVRYARNITDIDDKIMAKAVAENRSPQAVAAEYEAAYFEDMAALGCLKPDFNPRATEHIAGDHGMVAMIAALIARGHAYAAEGHVLFDVGSFAGYGQLSRRPMDEMIAGARVEVAPYKRSPGDFVLWKPSTPEQPGWESPWGRGRPGWHIECSAMIRAVLGVETIDIHGGGLDLQFPHHENERAQSCCAHDGAELSRIWMHNGFLTMGETKMSKSLGNIITPRELLDAGWDGEVLRLALLSAHYRQPLKWDDALLAQTRAIYRKFCSEMLILDVHDREQISLPDKNSPVVAALNDDMNTKLAVDCLHNAYRVAKNHQSGAVIARSQGENDSKIKSAEYKSFFELRNIGLLLGLDLRVEGSPEMVSAIASISDILTQEEVDLRSAAKLAHNWAEADRIRNKLKANGIRLKDNKDGTTSWERV